MKNNCFDENKLRNILKKPDWYLEFVPLLKNKKAKLKTESNEAYRECKYKLYEFFEENLKKENIFLGDSGKDWDEDRNKIDTIVIHHTKTLPGLTKSRLSAMTLMRLYATYYANPYQKKDKDIIGDPIYSNHFRDGRQVFWPYHWIVRIDGSYERLLNDNEIGWHSGNWDVNTRSVGIAINNDYENKKPSQKELKAVAKVIRENYPHVDKKNIIGHCEVDRQKDHSKITCPSNLFLSTENKKGWKEDLLSLI